MKLKDLRKPILLLLFLVACVEKMQLPDILENNVEFSAGDTTYLLIRPIWDQDLGLEAPVEIAIAQDGHVFIADSAAKSIFVFGQDGHLLSGFEQLRDLSVRPIDVDIDQKMNVYFIDGSGKIYVWNQYINDVGIAALAVSASFYNENAGSVTINSFTPEWMEYLRNDEWHLEYVNWGTPQDLIDSLLAPRLFFDSTDPRQTFNDIYYDSEESTFSGISATDDEDNFIYVLDYTHDRIIRIDLQRTCLLELSTGEEIWSHWGEFKLSVSEAGAGAGTVDSPLGIDVDYSGNIYYTQSGGSFSVHKIQLVTSGTYTRYLSVFQQDTNDIMDPLRFDHPSDVAVDDNQFVYVANTQAQEIQVFDSEGQFFLKAGVETVPMDTTLEVMIGGESVLVDTFLTIEEKGFLVEPQAVAVDTRGIVYICDTATGRILRYRLSNQLDEDLQPIP